ncbi:MAG TPA: hypothetical protein VMZ29_08665, partial [Candidatus Bathyarchaeia archaeon]|nr:hypothetical protein [Candidatus Bathyarchaeia archaeon]
IFICNSDPIVTYFIGKKLIGLELEGQCYSDYRYAYHLLGNLLLNPNIQTNLPRDIAENHKEDFAKYQSESFCISGGIGTEDFVNKCLSFKLKILDSNEDKKIHLYDFIILSGNARDLFVDTIADTFNFTPKETFILLSNICLSSKGIWRFAPDSNKIYHDVPTIRNLTTLYYDQRKGLSNHYSNSSLQIAFYCIDYYIYLIEQVTSGELSLEQLLRLSGTKILTAYLNHLPIVQAFIREKINLLINQFDFLPQDQKVMYFTLLILAEYYGSITEIDSFFNVNKSTIHEITKQLSKKFPKKQGSRKKWGDVYKDYLSRDFKG